MAGALHSNSNIYIGDYKVFHRRILGSGTFGRVCKATHNLTGEILAVKETNLGNAGRQQNVVQEMAEKELDILLSLQEHPNIIRFHDHVLLDGSFWIFMEFCDLGNLNEYLTKNTHLSMNKKARVMQQIIAAIHFMHSQPTPVIHRDMKLENVLMKTDKGEVKVKVTDFGLSTLLNKHLKSKMKSICGTEYYLAPELFDYSKGQPNYDSSIDVFAVGLIGAVLVRHGPEYLDLHPLSVSSLASENRTYYFGKEVLDCVTLKKPLPSLFKERGEEEDSITVFKALIRRMTMLHPKDRKPISDAYIDIRNIVDQTSQEESKRRQIGSGKNIKTRPDRNIANNPMPVQTTSSRERRQLAIQVRSKTTPGIHEGSSISLSPLKTTICHIHSKKPLSGWPTSLTLIRGDLWSCQMDGIFVYDQDLNLKHKFPCSGQSRVWAVSEVRSGVVIARSCGLFLWTSKGENVGLDEGYFTSVSYRDGQIYGAIQNESSSAIVVYDEKTRKKVQDISAIHSGKHHHTLHANEHDIYLACQDTCCIYILGHDGNLRYVHGKLAHRLDELHTPQICQVDADGYMLVSENEKSRMQIGKVGLWSKVQAKPSSSIFSGVVGAVYTGRHLFASLGNSKHKVLAKYQLINDYENVKL